MDIKKKLREEINKEVLVSNQMITESSINRLMGHLAKHDGGIITSNRVKWSGCGNNTIQLDKEFDKNKNQEHYKLLRSILMKFGYGITKIKGSWPEDDGKGNKKIVNEPSFFVVNLNDDPNFKNNLIKLGELFCQDSILIIESGGENAYLYGTNKTDNPGYGVTDELGEFHIGDSDIKSVLGNKSFYFSESIQLETIKDKTFNTQLLIDKLSKKIINSNFFAESEDKA